MNVRHEQRHRPAFRDFKGFVEVALRALVAGAGAGEEAQPGAGEQAAGEEILIAGAAEAVHGVLEGLAARIELVERYARQNRRIERGAAEGELVERDVEERLDVLFSPIERPRRALGDGRQDSRRASNPSDPSLRA
jgi:hypothetical protein